MNNKTYIFLADGFEEIEALATIDLLRRGGVDVKSVSINKVPEVVGANGIRVTADMILDDMPEGDPEMLIVPGGQPGSNNLAKCVDVTRRLQKQARRGGNIAAICAAPAVVLAPLEILKGRKAICYPGLEEGLVAGGATVEKQRVVEDGNVITSNGPSSAFLFALAIIRKLKGADAAEQVASGILL